MGRIAVLSFITGLLLVLLLTVGYGQHTPLLEDAQAHAKGYCGHGTKKGTVLGPYGFLEFREIYLWSWGAGPHYHSYKVYVWSNGTYKWIFIHNHTRVCNPHPV